MRTQNIPQTTIFWSGEFDNLVENIEYANWWEIGPLNQDNWFLSLMKVGCEVMAGEKSGFYLFYQLPPAR